MTSHDAALLDKMTESAGELLFEATAHEDPFARGLLIELAHQLGRLYGETIRACKGYNGLQDEVTDTFMTGMALEPNFGREEETKGAGQLLYEERVNPISPTWAQLDDNGRLFWESEAKNGAEAKAERECVKTPGRLLFEKECGSTARSWDKLHLSFRIAYENSAKRDAAIEKMLDAPVGTPFATIDWDKDDEVQPKAEEAKPKAVCFKCKGSGNMGFSTYMRCDACG